jgi:NADPH:quinone reductase-like Zn-dependent oxidoreductase
MRAAYIEQYGGTENILVGERPDPQPGAGEVLLDVKAAALNHLDVWVRIGRGGDSVPRPHILGSDAAGVVAELGHGVDHLELGQEVVLNPGFSCRRCAACRRGQQSECEEFGLVGFQRPGTYAEKVAVPATSVYPKPASLSFGEAAALALAHVTAWRMLMHRAKLRPGETVLIHGIGGGVAMAGLQIARLIGARAIVTSSSDGKLEAAAKMGAEHGINYERTEDVAAKVRDLTDGRGVDVALDAVGAATWPIDLEAVRKAGRVVICGVTTGAEAATNLQAVYWNQLSLLGSTMGSDEDFREMLAAVEATGLKPVIDRAYRLDQVRDATDRMERGEQMGKLVIEVAK